MAIVSLSKRLFTVDLTPRIGTQISADVAALLSGAHTGDIQDILDRRGVVVFRDLHLSDVQQSRFSSSFGEMAADGETHLFPISLDPNVTDLAKEYLKGSFFWHIDGAGDNYPPRTAILNARRISPIGGQTQFCNSYAAWDDLPDSEKKAIEKLRVVHRFALPRRPHDPAPAPADLVQWQRHIDKVLPLVWNHRSGRKSLVLGSTASHIIGMSLDAGRLLLGEYSDWATQAKYLYRHDWRVGDLLMWDNRGTMHRAALYGPESGRLMIRSTILGDEPVV